MRSLSSLGIGLSLVFGSLFLALIAELYYVLWWKRRVTNTEIEDDYRRSSGREFFYLFCWKKPSSLSSTALNPQDAHVHVHEAENQQQTNTTSKDFLLKPYGEEGIETELMRLHNLQGPPRFLFTIKEETKEDLESEDGRSRKGSRNRSLSDLLLTMETPFLTPLSSPAFFTPPLTPIDSYNGFNPLFESSTDVEMSGLKASPPPKFKFLKDAEEKLQRRIIEENKRKGRRSFESTTEDGKDLKPPPKVKIEDDGSYITILVSKNQEKEKEKEKEKHQPHHHSSSSQVLPLSSSPSAIRSPNMKPMFN